MSSPKPTSSAKTDNPHEKGPVGNGNYIVQSGDCVSSIAQEQGFFWETIWNHPNNAQLTREREDPNVLFAGDKLFIPDKQIKHESGQTEQKHTFKVKNAPAQLRMRLIDRDEKPRKSVRYVLVVDGTTHEGTTDNQGHIDAPIPPNAKKAMLVVMPKDDKAKPDPDQQFYNGPPPDPENEPAEQDTEEYEIELGVQDPASEVRGLQERLLNLGYRLDRVTGVYDEDTRAAVRAFQQRHDLAETGVYDDDTKSKLEDLHRS